MVTIVENNQRNFLGKNMLLILSNRNQLKNFKIHTVTDNIMQYLC